MGIDGAWVYPIAAFAPIYAASVFGFALYSGTWLGMVIVLDCIALAFLTRWGRSRSGVRLGWWWISFLLLLGPIALGRLDSITVPIGIVAVLFLASRPRLAALLLILGAWIKIWPVAVLGAILIAGGARGRILSTTLCASIVIVGLALAFGSGGNVVSFITEQTGRGLQLEAPVSTAWMWQVLAGVPGASIYFDSQILSNQVAGQGTGFVSELMNPMLALAVAMIGGLGIAAVRRRNPVTELLPTLCLAFVLCLIVFNEVGSPQYILWLAIPVILGLATHATGHGRSFRLPAIVVPLLAALTQVIYPYLYDYLLHPSWWMLGVLTLRNLLLVLLLAWAVRVLWKLGSTAAVQRRRAPHEVWLPDPWPVGKGKLLRSAQRTGFHAEPSAHHAPSGEVMKLKS